MAIGIKDVAGYLPAKRVRNVDVAGELGFKPGFLEEKVGVDVRYVSAPDESTSAMCVKAFESLRVRYPQNYFDDVGLLLLCTQNPDYKLPHTSSVLQAKLGLPKTVLTFDVSLGCSGFVATVVTAKALMNDLGLRKGLVFTCDPYTKVLAGDDKSTVPLFSDAAAVTLLEIEAPLQIGRATFGNDGSLCETLIIRGSGTARVDGEIEQPLRMDGRNIFAMLKTEVPISIRSCAEANGLTLDQIDMFLFHQASGWLLKVLSSDLGLAAERVPTNLKNVGNTISSSIPLLLDEILRRDQPLPRTILMSGFGVGLSWASVVLSNSAA
ncbi:MAG TPA: ketoacyl-ACP synthase III [Terriglobales bacterium]|nr:ketoacyl-ACP synthase III [Terriglobales bacterium]